MLEQRALVTQVFAQQVEVEIEIQSSCSGCSSQDSCSVGTVAKAFSGKTQRLRIDTQLILNTGQWVTIATVESSVLFLAAITYLLPLAGLLSVGVLTQWLLVDVLKMQAWLAVVSAVAGGYFAFLIGRFLVQRDSTKQPHIEIVSGHFDPLVSLKN
ncbi:MAG: SoxR reducing system RseC family protein [Psychrobium sp.]|nr:SoxR reducing system RseC family protein [Psychrobium sp.]